MSLKNYWSPDGLEAGCDEAGRGCLAGAVVAAAVILPQDFHHPLLNDSKQLSEKQRDRLRPIIEREALSFGIGRAEVEEIDALNISNASFLAMHRAIAQLHILPTRLLIDGNRFNPYPHIPHECIVRGDALFTAIAAASILAKTERDDIMKRLDALFPQYQWLLNKGYPTKTHRRAIALHGVSAQHRRTFKASLI